MQNLPDGTLRAASGLGVEKPESRNDLVTGSDGEGPAADLVAGAHREEHCAVVEGGEQSAIGLEFPDSGDLGGVLAASQQIDGPVSGHLLTGLDGDELGVDAAPLQPLGEDDCIAVVAVDAQQGLVQQDDLGTVGVHVSPPSRRSFWKGV